jgi:methanogenic corrinoid protein MtbC1
MQAHLKSHTNELYQHLVAGDEAACRRYIKRLRSDDGVPILDVCEQLTDAFHSIGDAWACSDISVYREHVASQLGCRLLLDLRSSLQAVPSDAPTAIGCTPEGDPYSMPTLMVELVLHELGWDATSLGTNLPLELLAPAIEDYRPDMCWVSVSFADSQHRLRQQLQFLSECAQTCDCRVLVGGQAIDDDLQRSFRQITFVDCLGDLELILNADD